MSFLHLLYGTKAKLEFMHCDYPEFLNIGVDQYISMICFLVGCRPYYSRMSRKLSGHDRERFYWINCRETFKDIISASCSNIRSVSIDLYQSQYNILKATPSDLIVFPKLTQENIELNNKRVNIITGFIREHRLLIRQFDIGRLRIDRKDLYIILSSIMCNDAIDIIISYLPIPKLSYKHDEQYYISMLPMLRSLDIN